MMDYDYQIMENKFHCFYTLDNYLTCFYYFENNQWRYFSDEEERIFESNEEVLEYAAKHVRTNSPSTRRVRTEDMSKFTPLEMTLKLLMEQYQH